jgi:hypothetical protein
MKIKLIPIIEKDNITDSDMEGIIKRNNISNFLSNTDRWKEISILFNTNSDLTLLNKGKRITIDKDSAVLIEDIMSILKFNSKIDLFNFLDKNYKIYDDTNIVYKHACGIKERRK